MTSYFQTRALDDGSLLVVMDDPSGSTNRTTARFKDEFDALLAGIETAATAARPRGLIFASAKASFGVGGDVAEILGHAGTGYEASLADSMRIKGLFRRLEALGIPTVACLSGTAVGGGLELALACNARIARDDPAIRIGFPEVSLGLVPGAGGILRTVHLLGVDRALPLIADGRLITPGEAAAIGLLTSLVPTAEALVPMAQVWIASHPGARQPWDQRGHRVPGGTLFDSPKRYIGLQTRTARAVRNGQGRRTAEGAALGCIAEVAALSFADGAIVESRAFARRACGAEARAAIGLRFIDRRVARAGGEAVSGVGHRAAQAALAAFSDEVRRLAMEGIGPARLANGVLHAGYGAAMLETAQAAAADVAGRGASAALPLGDIEERLLHAQLAAVLNVMASAGEHEDSTLTAAVNVAAVDEGGFPAWTGGPLRFSAERGDEATLAALDRLAARHGPHFLPPVASTAMAPPATVSRSAQPEGALPR